MYGLIDGIKDIYSGEDTAVKHISIFSLCAIIGVVFSIAASGLPKDTKSSVLLLTSYFSLNPLLILLSFLAALTLLAYWMMFIHKTLKKFSAMGENDIMPYIDSDLITPIIPAIPLWIVWTIYNIIGAIIPVFNIFWSLVIQPFCIPYVFIAFCKEFKTKELFSIKYVFDIMGKVFLPSLILSLKYLVLLLALTIPMFALGFGILHLPKDIAMSAFMAVMMYFIYILSLVYVYCQAYIYSENVYEINFNPNA